MTATSASVGRGKIQNIHIWANSSLLGNKALVERLLDRIVDAIGMTPHGPVMFREYPTTHQEPGTSAFVAMLPLRESYIVFDNWIEFTPGYANIVINSCRGFQVAAAIAVIDSLLQPVHVRVSLWDEYSPDSGVSLGGKGKG